MRASCGSTRRALSAARYRVVRSSRLPALLIGWPLRSVWPVSDALGKAGEGPELGRGGEPGGGAHGGDQGRPADLGQAGQAAGQPCWVDPAVAGLPLGRVAVQLGLGGGKQAELGGDLGGQILKGDSGVVGVQLQRGAGGAKPLLGPGRALLAVGGLGDHLLQPSSPGSNQRVGIGVAFQHRQVGLAEFASQWRLGMS